MSVSFARPQVSRRVFQGLMLAATGSLISLSLACGNSTSKTTTTTPPPTTTPNPSQPSYPSTPPVPINWSPQSSPLPAPAAQVPPPPGSNDFPLTISSPTDGGTVTSPANVVNSINTQIYIAPGTHTLEVMAEDDQGYISATILNITVSSQAAQTTISDIQTLPGWQSCSALFPTGSGRDGQICAAGLGTADSTMTENQSSPAMDGKSAKFTMGGPTPYSNMLYFNAVAGGNNVSHFIYDLYFYIDNPAASQALEFDINQTYGGNRWVWDPSATSMVPESGTFGTISTVGSPLSTTATLFRQIHGFIWSGTLSELALRSIT